MSRRIMGYLGPMTKRKNKCSELIAQKLYKWKPFNNQTIDCNCSKYVSVILKFILNILRGLKYKKMFTMEYVAKVLFKVQMMNELDN
jgi:hypothetical protein